MSDTIAFEGPGSHRHRGRPRIGAAYAPVRSSPDSGQGPIAPSPRGPTQRLLMRARHRDAPHGPKRCARRWPKVLQGSHFARVETTAGAWLRDART